MTAHPAAAGQVGGGVSEEMAPEGDAKQDLKTPKVLFTKSWSHAISLQ